MALKCPHCGQPVEIPFLRPPASWRRRNGSHQPGQFQSTALVRRDAPRPGLWGALSSFVFFMRGGTYKRPTRPAHITLRVENIVSPQQTKINQLQLPVTEQELGALADLFLRRGENWAKSKTRGIISQPKHDKLKDAFLDLWMLRDIGAGDKHVYELTRDGRNFLSCYLPENPPPLTNDNG